MKVSSIGDLLRLCCGCLCVRPPTEEADKHTKKLDYFNVGVPSISQDSRKLNPDTVQTYWINSRRDKDLPDQFTPKLFAKMFAKKGGVKKTMEIIKMNADGLEKLEAIKLSGLDYIIVTDGNDTPGGMGLDPKLTELIKNHPRGVFIALSAHEHVVKTFEKEFTLILASEKKEKLKKNCDGYRADRLFAVVKGGGYSDIVTLLFPPVLELEDVQDD